MNRNAQTAALMAGVLLVGSNAFVLSPILTEVARSLNTSPVQVAWAISSFGAATACSALMLSHITDRHGPRISLTLAALTLMIAQILCVFSTGWVWLCSAQALAGVAVGVLLPGIYVTVTATAPKGREAARLGFVLTGWALSLVVAVPASATITEHFGWQPVYGGLAFLSGIIALCLWCTIPGGHVRMQRRTSLLFALRLPGVLFLLIVSFGFMTAFYGTYAYFGEGIRTALNLSAKGAGFYVLAYGGGFGLAGLLIGRLAPRPGRRPLMLILTSVSATNLLWIFALENPVASFALTAFWGFQNQFVLNALIVLLNRLAAHAKGAVMGINSAVTYGAVFAGPFCMGPVYQSGGFIAVTILAAIMVAASAIAVLIGGDRISGATPD